jgi:phosphohistidine phosphatase
MQVLIVRHATAEDDAPSDELRPLSEKGIANMRENVQGLQKILPTIDVIVNSPLLRAQQTADLIAAAYSNAQRETWRALAPMGSEIQILEGLQKIAKDHQINTVTLVGHEPNLGKLATWFLTGKAEYWMPFKKGAACLVEFPQKIKAGEAELSWALKPAQLRLLASSTSSE